MTEANEIAIEILVLSKKYYLRNEKSSDVDASNGFYALQNVSFTINKGDVVGIIGNNGSGKTTLLRILSQITKPSSGEARFYGSVTSILEIGTNFHPDLTGRENVLLQLKLAKTSKREFSDLQNRIHEFSEIGEFFDQPVKFYSSGMFLRLAFSLAFHLSSDILILDEVLSVGDEGFRLKCYELLAHFTKQGKTILFVSHNRLEILELSNKCIWIDKGHIKKIGIPSVILAQYFALHRDNYDDQKLVITPDEFHLSKQHEEEGGLNLSWSEEDAPGNEILSIRQLTVTPTNGSKKLLQTIPIKIKFVIYKKMAGIQIGAFFFLQDVFYQPVLVGHFLNNLMKNDFGRKLKDEIGLIEISCIIPADFLIPGKYYLLPRFGMEKNDWNPNSEEAFRFSDKMHFIVEAESGYFDLIGDISKGSVRPPLEWQIEKLK